MKLKNNVQAAGIKPEMIIALMVATRIWLNFGQVLVCTSIMDGKHCTTSKHYLGLASDYRTRYFSMAEKKAVFKLLKEDLGPEYKVVWHSSHLHTEFRGSVK